MIIITMTRGGQGKATSRNPAHITHYVPIRAPHPTLIPDKSLIAPPHPNHRVESRPGLSPSILRFDVYFPQYRYRTHPYTTPPHSRGPEFATCSCHAMMPSPHPRAIPDGSLITGTLRVAATSLQ
jgi:hypothetical protein